MELDQLYKKLNVAPSERLSFLEKQLSLVEKRDDLYLERLTLYNQLGAYEKANELLARRHFHPWEGGEGKVSFQYTFCRLELAKQALKRNDYQQALKLILETDNYPENIGEGKLSTLKENDIEYYKGVCYRGLGDETTANAWFEKATQGPKEPRQAFFYHDESPDNIFYQGLAWRALGNEQQANERFATLIAHGQEHWNDRCKLDYFAVSLPDLAIWNEDLNQRNRIHCAFVMALGYYGQGSVDQALHYIEEIEKMDVNHQRAQALKSFMQV
jgi:tetratricopeptide (TPR) repeat protein